jgi:hypothetical protein
MLDRADDGIPTIRMVPTHGLIDVINTAYVNVGEVKTDRRAAAYYSLIEVRRGRCAMSRCRRDPRRSGTWLFLVAGMGGLWSPRA